ncbi:MAG: aspartate carbamoyltransferase regulatory subunit [Candidatus Lokiarchaeota archaeon]|nr:aspartate carbamoyltransferase regulatory subunit [Candidatus Lokiarchaeota archaeon]MBD3198702.1 aspartate carbamoyltransferase regulatory subunit [Candidatus Lokiarchaeota archaeon]
MSQSENLRIDRIQKGTVIDHIDAGYALTILNLTGLDESPNLMTIGVNVSSQKYGKKDIVKIENVFLNEIQMQQISILSPNATISLIEDFNVIEKKKVKMPSIIKKLIVCETKTCVSNSQKEPIDTEFLVLEEKPLKIRCAYCDRIYKLDEIKFKSRRKKGSKKVKQKISL